mgnify:FL=1
MALDDINFNEGEGQDFIVELPLGTLGTPTDVLVEASGGQFPVNEIAGQTGGEDIFIIND